jgi:hypothetical protein
VFTPTGWNCELTVASAAVKKHDYFVERRVRRSSKKSDRNNFEIV